MATRRQLVGLGTVAALTGAYAWYFLGKRRIREQRRLAIQSIPRISLAGKFKELGPSRFLERWSDEVLARLRRAQFPLDKLQAEVLAAGSILRPGATLAAVKALEERLGLKLPESLRALYLKSNGIYAHIWYGGERYDLFPTSQVRWLHEVDPQLVRIWTTETPSNPSDEKYFVYGPKQDVITIRTDYLQKMVCLTPVLDGGAMLLNAALPALVGTGGVGFFCQTSRSDAIPNAR